MPSTQIDANSINQDAREVKTKFSRTFQTFFFPVGDEIRKIVAEWVSHLREGKLWGNDDPLFPATRIALGATRHFEVSGLERDHWSSASPIRTIFRNAFVSAGLPYFNPHSFRNTLVQLGQAVCKSPEHFKAWSQNLGHERVLTIQDEEHRKPSDFIYLARITEWASDNQDLAFILLDEAEKFAPGYWQALHFRAEFLNRAKQPKSALYHVQRACVAAPWRAECWRLAAQIYGTLGMPDEAAAAEARASKLPAACEAASRNTIKAVPREKR